MSNPKQHIWYIPILIRDNQLLGKVVELNRPMLCQQPLKLNVSALMSDFMMDDSTDSSDNQKQIIARFLAQKNLRIRAEKEDGKPIQVAVITPEIEDDLDNLSEELAQIYSSQGQNDKAIEIYTKLSLLNSEKSIYFAELIEQLRATE